MVILFLFFFISIKSHNNVSFAAVDLVLCSIFFLFILCVFFFLRLSGEQVNSKNVCIFPLVINVLCALLAVYANDIVDQLRDDGKQQRPAFNTLMGYRRSISLGSSLTKIQIKLCAAHVHTSEKRKKNYEQSQPHRCLSIVTKNSLCCTWGILLTRAHKTEHPSTNK